MKVKVVLFDMDGTIWNAPVDWGEARRRIGVPDDGLPIAHHLTRLPQEERAEKEALLRRFEAEGVKRGRPAPGAAELLRFLQERGIRCALVTNNSRESAEAVLRATGLSFDAIFTREDGILKPEPEALLRPLTCMGASPEEAVLVGDSHHDLAAAQRAGIREVILVSPSPRARSFFPPGARFREAKDLFEARAILEEIIRAEP
ncbi:HAD family hydrolase [Candidatus Bipolaricaulota sp. J31]